MKIRSNYVSNSSSTSFCIAGVPYDKEKFNVIVDKLDLFDAFDRFFKSALDYEYDFDASHDIENEIGPLMTYYDANEDCKSIGISVDEMQQLETRNEFFKMVYEKLREIGYNGSVDDVQFMTGTYRI